MVLVSLSLVCGIWAMSSKGYSLWVTLLKIFEVTRIILQAGMGSNLLNHLEFWAHFCPLGQAQSSPRAHRQGGMALAMGWVWAGGIPRRGEGSPEPSYLHHSSMARRESNHWGLLVLQKWASHILYPASGSQPWNPVPWSFLLPPWQRGVTSIFHGMKWVLSASLGSPALPPGSHGARRATEFSGSGIWASVVVWVLSQVSLDLESHPDMLRTYSGF